jgi:leucyl-tRNA synthetase
VIANEQVLADGTCERSGDVIEKREMPQWMLRITKYADRLTDDLSALDWPEHIKEAQRQWIGRSKGAEIDFTLSTSDQVTVFTTRPDTLFGATYLVLAPEHPLLQSELVRGKISNLVDVDAYVAKAKQTDEQDRLDATKEKTGVNLEGVTATNPASGEVIPVFVADYVLGGYGTGAIMAVPAHDTRDSEFAKKFGIQIKTVVEPIFTATTGESAVRPEAGEYVFRNAVVAVVRNPKDDTYLCVSWKSAVMNGLVTGGIEDGEDPVEAARREVAEETGYTNLLHTPRESTIIHSRFYHRMKQQNRWAKFQYVFFDLVDDTRNTVDAKEAAEHEVSWRTTEALRTFFTVIEGEYIVDVIEGKNNLHTSAGILTNSGDFDGMDSEEAKEKIVEMVGVRMTATYRIRDWSIGRQRYWGVPIPIVYSPDGVAYPVPEEHLPWTLPEDVDFTPTGEPPLAKSEVLKKRTEEIFGAGWTPEVETMDTFVDSSWYFLRYLDNKNETSLASLETQKDWMPIDIYFGGAEHTTMHLLYSRFWQKALFDLGLVTESEPYRRRVNRGLILGPDGNKMSKSKGNVIDPDEQVALVGADTVKMYLAFMGPYEGNNYPWDMGGIAGLRRFLERVYGLTEHLIYEEPTTVTRQLHKTIIKVGNDVTEFKFNTAISAMMIFVNLAEKQGLTKDSYRHFLRILSPFAPHLTEEIWAELGYTTSIHLEQFPVADISLATDTEIKIGVQINGKMRGTIVVAPDASEATALAAAHAVPNIAEKITGGTITKVIYIQGKILNIIVV